MNLDNPKQAVTTIPKQGIKEPKWLRVLGQRCGVWSEAAA